MEGIRTLLFIAIAWSSKLRVSALVDLFKVHLNLVSIRRIHILSIIEHQATCYEKYPRIL